MECFSIEDFFDMLIEDEIERKIIKLISKDLEYDEIIEQLLNIENQGEVK
ncbi:MAG: hypothetical protein ACUVXA_14890 [Candidatus Jordarchaeum sp.]